MWALPGPLSEKLNFKLVINSKTDFSGGGQKCIKLHFNTKFHFKTSFRSSWNFQKLLQVRYTSDLRTFEVAKFYFQDQGVHFDVKYFFNKITVT